jgi:hypothetical protein
MTDNFSGAILTRLKNGNIRVIYGNIHGGWRINKLSNILKSKSLDPEIRNSLIRKYKVGPKKIKGDNMSSRIARALRPNVNNAPVKKIKTGTAAGQKYTAITAFGLDTAPGNSNHKKEQDSDVTEVVDDLTDGPENATNVMLPTGIDPRIKGEFKRSWKASMSQQIKNGSFLEFQGMRFVKENAEVYDAERNNERNGKNVFGHIILPAPVPRVYLKCKFKLEEVNNDNNVVVPGGPTWASLKNISKGVSDCEPDVIVRQGNKIKIFEMKMGLGKKETNKQPSEYFQLIRAVRLMQKWLNEPEFASGRNLQIEIYFIGWSATISANGRSNLEFNRPSWEPTSGPYHSTATNGAGMAQYAPINSAIVNTVISLLNFEKLKALYKALTPILSGWGSQKPAVNAWYKSQMLSLRNKSYNAAINKPPIQVPVEARRKTAAAIAASAATEAGLRQSARGVFKRARNQNANYNSNTNEGRAKRFTYTAKKLKPNTLSRSLLNTLTTAQLQNLLSRSVARNRASPSKPYMNTERMNSIINTSENFEKDYTNFLRDHAPENMNAARAAFGMRINQLARNPNTNSNARDYYSRIARNKAAINARNKMTS